MTDVSAGFRPPCWCPCRWAPTWRFHTNLYKFGENVSPHIFHKKNCCDPNLGERLCIHIFFLFPGSGLNLLNGFDFLFWSILNSVTLKTSNWYPNVISYNNLRIQGYFQPKIGRKVRIFSLRWKTTFLEKKRVCEQTYLESRTEVRCKQKYRATVAIYAN